MEKKIADLEDKLRVRPQLDIIDIIDFPISAIQHLQPDLWPGKCEGRERPSETCDVQAICQLKEETSRLKEENAGLIKAISKLSN